MVTLEAIRYHFSVTCLVMGCSGLPAAIVVLCIAEIIPLEGEHRLITFLTAYAIIVVFGLRYYIPRLRGFA